MSQAELQVFNDSCWILYNWKSQLSAAFSFNLPLPTISLMLLLVSLIALFLLEASFLPLHISFSLSVMPSTIMPLFNKKRLGRKSLNKQIENTDRKFVILNKKKWEVWKEEKCNVRWGKLLVLAVVWITTFSFPKKSLKIRVSERCSHGLSRPLKLFKADSLIILFSFTCQMLMLKYAIFWRQ